MEALAQDKDDAIHSKDDALVKLAVAEERLRALDSENRENIALLKLWMRKAGESKSQADKQTAENQRLVSKIVELESKWSHTSIHEMVQESPSRGSSSELLALAASSPTGTESTAHDLESTKCAASPWSIAAAAESTTHDLASAKCATSPWSIAAAADVVEVASGWIPNGAQHTQAHTHVHAHKYIHTSCCTIIRLWS